jgi:hypothetical protein
MPLQGFMPLCLQYSIISKKQGKNYFFVAFLNLLMGEVNRGNEKHA